MTPLLVAVETGGTKIIARLCGTGIDREARWATTTPDVAADQIAAFVREEQPAGTRVVAAGLAAFGPLVLDGVDAGRMLATPKLAWTGSNLRAGLADRLDCPVAVDTDVNAAARAELDRACDLPSLAYVTVGTGIGGGLASTAGALCGALHPEVGHLRLIRDTDDTVPSQCPFHADCAEGLAAGPAVRARLAGTELTSRSDVRERIAGYLGQLLVGLVLTWSPHRIVLGGGVASAPDMIAAVRRSFTRQLGGYGVGSAAQELDFIRPPQLADAGLAGALLMAHALASMNGDIA
ncbi:ROK family protein [Sphingomonas melonis]